MMHTRVHAHRAAGKRPGSPEKPYNNSKEGEAGHEKNQKEERTGDSALNKASHRSLKPQADAIC